MGDGGGAGRPPFRLYLKRGYRVGRVRWSDVAAFERSKKVGAVEWRGRAEAEGQRLHPFGFASSAATRWAEGG